MTKDQIQQEQKEINNIIKINEGGISANDEQIKKYQGINKEYRKNLTIAKHRQKILDLIVKKREK